MSRKSTAFPYIIWISIFVIVPLFVVIYFAFTNESGNFTLDNIKEIEKYSHIYLKSFNLAVIATVICLVLSYPLAFLISRLKKTGQSTMLMLIMLPMWMSFLLRTYAWMTLLEGVGLINSFLGLFGIGPFDMINTQGAVVLAMVYNYIPFMILPLYSIMTKIDVSIIEAAQDLGANRLKVLLKILLPLTSSGIITGVIMVFVPSVSTFIISRMLGGGENMLIGDLIERQFLGGYYNPYLGSALALVLMVIMLIMLGIMNLFDDEQMEGMVV